MPRVFTASATCSTVNPLFWSPERIVGRSSPTSSARSMSTWISGCSRLRMVKISPRSWVLTFSADRARSRPVFRRSARLKIQSFIAAELCPAESLCIPPEFLDQDIICHVGDFGEFAETYSDVRLSRKQSGSNSQRCSGHCACDDVELRELAHVCIEPVAPPTEFTETTFAQELSKVLNLRGIHRYFRDAHLTEFFLQIFDIFGTPRKIDVRAK